MTKSKSTKKALLASVLSMLVCVSMLIGSTFAWFTDSVTTGVNKIVAGNLDVELEYATAFDAEGNITKWTAVDKSVSLFKDVEDDGSANLWEPGHTEVVYLRIRNAGSLALQYQFTVDLNKTFNTQFVNVYGDWVDLVDFLVFDQIEGVTKKYATREDVWAASDAPLGIGDYAKTNTLLKPGDEEYVALAIYMPTYVGNEANCSTAKWTGKIENMGITLVATQTPYEKDSFDDQYDVNAQYPWNGRKDAEGLVLNTNDSERTVNIDTPAQLASFADAVNSGTSYKGYTVRLANDIDLNNKAWKPIGKSGSTFQGVFDGQNHTISNLYINTPNSSNVGLFGYTTDGEVKNVILHNASVKGNQNVGAVAGSPYTSKYTNISLTGTVTVDGYAYVGGAFGKNVYKDLTDITIDVEKGSYVKADSDSYRTYVGGVVGFMGEGKITVKNVTSNIDVTGSTCDVGGITGIAHYNNTFINCHSSGNVTLTSANDSGDEKEIGGIAGVWHNQNGTTVTLTNCSYTGILSSNNVNTGALTDFENNGLVGRQYSASGTGTLLIN